MQRSITKSFTIWLATCMASACGAEYFVDPAGSDGASGNAAAPWQTLQFAAQQVAPGDRVVVQPGSYAGFHLTTSGLPASPIEFFAQSGAQITERNPVTIDGINLEGASHVIVDGFTVAGMPRAGVRAVGAVDDFAEFVTVRNVVAADNFKWGIFTGFVDDLLIEHNEAYGAEDEHGIYVSNSGDRPVIRHNEIWGNHANGIHMNGDAALGDDGVISGALVSGNVIYDNGVGGGSGINMDGVQDSRIENNLIYNTRASGISLYQIDGGEPSTGNVVVNNTVHVADDGRWALNIQNGSSGNTVLNNILLNEHSFRGAIDVSASSLEGLVSDYNVVISRFTTSGGNSVFSLEDWQLLTGNDEHSLVGEAGQLFVDAPAGKYDLLPVAGAIDAGTAMRAPLIDLKDRPRPAGDGYDIGAFELSTLSADFNADGQVDGDDLTQWEGDFGLKSLSDADGDEDSDGADFIAWQGQFGGGGAPTFVVPEPLALTLLALAALPCALLGRRATQRP